MGDSPLPDGQPPRLAPLTADEIARYVVTAAVWAPSVHTHGRGWGLPPLSITPRFRAAGVAAVLTTAHDCPVDWIGAGLALQRILLTASTWGVAAAALHTQPLELGWLRESIRTPVSDGAYPQLVLRFGTVIQAAASVRRPPGDVLSGSGGEHHGSSHE